MAHPLSKNTYTIATVCSKLWEEKLKNRAELCNLNANEVLIFITSETSSFLRTFPYHEELNLCADVKNDAKARDLRTKGNEMFHPKVKRYIEAIKLYNESIAYSEKGSEGRGIAYTNRSMICYEMRRYEDCLENIRLARESNYPARLAEHLNNREKKALKMMKSAETKSHKQEEFEDEIKLDYDAHENAPQIANCLELRRNVEFGCHVVTIRRLRAGDVIIIEKPYVTALQNDFHFIRCAFCSVPSPFTLIPCEGCTVTMYCSVECSRNAYRQYHRYECLLIKDLCGISGFLGVLALRSVLTAIASFDHHLEELKEYLDCFDETTVNAFDVDWDTASGKDIYSIYKPQHKLGQMNYDVKSHATACFPLISMLNHSCAPNLKLITLRDGRCAVVVIRPIAKGDQLFFNYQLHHLRQSLSVRQCLLQKRYQFECCCEACQQNYGTFKQFMCRFSLLDTSMIDTHLNKVRSYHLLKALTFLPILRNEMYSVSNIYRSNEVCGHQLDVERCYQVLYGYTAECIEYWTYCNP